MDAEALPARPFERYADDVICHCSTEIQARLLREKLEARFAEWKLHLHPQKTKIVYCKDSNHYGSHPEQQFDFLGYTFRPRKANTHDGRLFVGFLPAVSNKAAVAMRQVMRRWRLHLRADLTLNDLAQWIRSVVRGWIQYYGRFYGAALYRVMRHLDRFLVRWAQRKYKLLRQHRSRAWGWLQRIRSRQPTLFPHWRLADTVGR